MKNPLIANTREKLNLMQINFKNADGSTKSENQEDSDKNLNQQNIASTEEKEETKRRHNSLKKIQK